MRKGIAWMAVAFLVLPLGSFDFSSAVEDGWSFNFTNARTGQSLWAQGTTNADGVCFYEDIVPNADLQTFRNEIKAIYLKHTGKALLLPECNRVISGD
jgi:hypothetical protein